MASNATIDTKIEYAMVSIFLKYSMFVWACDKPRTILLIWVYAFIDFLTVFMTWQYLKNVEIKFQF